MRFGRCRALLGFPLLAACVAGGGADGPGGTHGGGSETPETQVGEVLFGGVSLRSGYESALARFRARDYSAARSAFEGLAEAAQGHDPEVRVQALAMVARLESITGTLEEAAAWLQRAEAEAVAARPQGWTRCRIVRGLLQRDRARAVGSDVLRVEAARTFVEAHDFAMQQGLVREALEAAYSRALLGSAEEQVAWGKTAVGLAEDLADDRWRAVSWNALGMGHQRVGDGEAMLAAYLKARTFHRRSGGTYEAIVADFQVATALRRTEELPAAEALLVEVATRAGAEAEARPDLYRPWVGYIARERCEVALRRGDPDTAAGHLDLAAEHLPADAVAEIRLRVEVAQRATGNGPTEPPAIERDTRGR